MAEPGEATQVFQKGWDGLLKNPVLIVPSLVAFLIIFVLSFLFVGSAVGMTMGGMMRGARGLGPGFGVLAGTTLLVMGLSIVLSMVAGGMMVAMAHDTLVGRVTSLGSGLAATRRRLGDLIVASILGGLIIGIGFMLFLVPGLIAAFFLLFTLPAVMLGGMSGTGALSASVKLVSSHLSDSLLLAFGLLVIGLLVGIVGMVFRFVPVLGALATVILQAVLAAYASLVIVAAYRRAEGLR